MARTVPQSTSPNWTRITHAYSEGERQFINSLLASFPHHFDVKQLEAMIQHLTPSKFYEALALAAFTANAQGPTIDTLRQLLPGLDNETLLRGSTSFETFIAL